MTTMRRSAVHIKHYWLVLILPSTRQTHTFITFMSSQIINHQLLFWISAHAVLLLLLLYFTPCQLLREIFGSLAAKRSTVRRSWFESCFSACCFKTKPVLMKIAAKSWRDLQSDIRITLSMTLNDVTDITKSEDWTGEFCCWLLNGTMTQISHTHLWAAALADPTDPYRIKVVPTHTSQLIYLWIIFPRARHYSNFSHPHSCV